MPRTPVPESHVGVLRGLHRAGGRASIADADAVSLGVVRSLKSHGLVKITGDNLTVTDKGARLLADPAQARRGRPAKRHEDTRYLASTAGEIARSEAAWTGETGQAQRRAFNAAAAKRLKAADPRRKVATEDARSELRYHGVHGPEIATPDRVGDYLRMIARTARTADAVADQWRIVCDSLLDQADPARRKTAERATLGAMASLGRALANGRLTTDEPRLDPDRLAVLNDALALFASKLPPA